MGQIAGLGGDDLHTGRAAEKEKLIELMRADVAQDPAIPLAEGDVRSVLIEAVDEYASEGCTDELVPIDDAHVLINRNSVAFLLAYVAGGGAANAFGKHLGIGNFRVLMVTTSPDRRDTMIAALRDATGGAGSRQFLFTDRDALRHCPHLLDLDWITGKGDTVRLSS